MTKHLSLFALLVVFLCGCSPDQDEVFDDSPSDRITSSIEEVNQVLKSSANGWYFELFTATGGTNVLVAFEDNKVTAADYRDGNAAAESLYSVIHRGGPVLSFDTYNPVIHAYSDPVAPDSYKGDNQGLGADFEFVVTSLSTDTVELRGVKHQKRCRLIRYTQETSWDETLTALSEMKEQIQAPLYDFYYNGELVSGTNLIADNVLTTYRVEGEETHAFTMAIVPTLEGFRTESPFSYTIHDANPKIQNFVFDAQADRFVCSNQGVDFYIQKKYPALNEVWTQTEDRWWFNVSFVNAPLAEDMSDNFVTAFTSFHETDCVPFGEKLNSVYMGANESYPNGDVNPFAFVSYSLKNTGSGYWKGIVGYTCEKVKGTDDQVVFSALNPTLNKSFYPNAQLIGQEFIDKGPWVLTADNVKAPTKFTLTSASDASVYITVEK